MLVRVLFPHSGGGGCELPPPPPTTTTPTTTVLIPAEFAHVVPAFGFHPPAPDGPVPDRDDHALWSHDQDGSPRQCVWCYESPEMLAALLAWWTGGQSVEFWRGPPSTTICAIAAAADALGLVAAVDQCTAELARRIRRELAAAAAAAPPPATTLSWTRAFAMETVPLERVFTPPQGVTSAI